ncbi:MAG: IS110 family transposase [Pseudomonadales bacterium]
MTAVLESKDNATGGVLYMALELSDKHWKLGFSNGDKNRQVTIAAGDWPALRAAVTQAKAKLQLAETGPVYSCYEAGRDGFWLHRALREDGIINQVIDSSSIEVNRRQRRAKTDSVDVKALLRLLQRYLGGERQVLSVVRVPTPAAEDQRRLHRERERLLKERVAHSARIKSLLVLQGVRLEVKRDFVARLAHLTDARGRPLGGELKAELVREYERYALVTQQIQGLEAEQKRRVKAGDSPVLRQIQQLQLLRGVGWHSSWPLVMEFFGWRDFRNRREVGSCAGLTPTPYNSGNSVREQGIDKAGNRRIRRVMVELSWLWLRHQPDSALSQWFVQRFAQGGKRMRRIGIVALARKLLIALWRYVAQGVVPEGAVFKPPVVPLTQ